MLGVSICHSEATSHPDAGSAAGRPSAAERRWCKAELFPGHSHHCGVLSTSQEYKPQGSPATVLKDSSSSAKRPWAGLGLLGSTASPRPTPASSPSLPRLWTPRHSLITSCLLSPRPSHAGAGKLLASVAKPLVKQRAAASGPHHQRN